MRDRFSAAVALVGMVVALATNGRLLSVSSGLLLVGLGLGTAAIVWPDRRAIAWLGTGPAFLLAVCPGVFILIDAISGARVTPTAVANLFGVYAALGGGIVHIVRLERELAAPRTVSRSWAALLATAIAVACIAFFGPHRRTVECHVEYVGGDVDTMCLWECPSRPPVQEETVCAPGTATVSETTGTVGGLGLAALVVLGFLPLLDPASSTYRASASVGVAIAIAGNLRLVTVHADFAAGHVFAAALAVAAAAIVGAWLQRAHRLPPAEVRA